MNEWASAERRLRRLDLQITRRLDGLLRGAYIGLLPGSGTQMDGSREYRPGEDDARQLDWAVTARTAVAHVRRTVADRELTVYLIVDATASMDFGTARAEKRDLAVGAAAAMGFLTLGIGNRVGLDVLRPEGTVRIPPRVGRAHLTAVLRALVGTPRAGAVAAPVTRVSRLTAGLVAGAATMSRRGLVVVISDFLDDLEATGDGPRFEWERGLRRLVAAHQVLAIEVLDPRELALPDIGVVTLVDPESGRRREVGTGSSRVRRRYAQAAAEHRAGVASAIRRTGAGHLVLRTDRDWIADIARHARARRPAQRTRLSPQSFTEPTGPP